MANGLDEMIARLRGIGAAARAALPEIAQEAKRVVLENVAAQRGPDGKPWPPTQAGTAALQNAGANLSAQVVGGKTILLTLGSPEARHNYGAVKGKVKRQILPTRGIPTVLAEAIRRVLVRRLTG